MVKTIIDKKIVSTPIPSSEYLSKWSIAVNNEASRDFSFGTNGQGTRKKSWDQW